MEHILRQNEIAGELFDIQKLTFSTWERITLVLFAMFVGTSGIIGGWSFILLITDNTSGGGPLGLIAGLLHFECLTCIG